MDNLIQKNIDSGNGIILLPPGEYQGPFLINHPCVIEGNGTTLWNRGETVLLINSDGVTLKNLRIELVEPSDESFSVCTSSLVVTDNIEITGRTAGFGEEDTIPEESRQLNLGKFSSETENTFIFEIYSPGTALLETDMNDIAIEPQKLIPGVNKVKISVSELPSGTFIYGDILMKSSFNRRYYVHGSSSHEAERITEKCIKTVDTEIIEKLKDSASELHNISSRQIKEVSEKPSEQEQSAVIEQEETHILTRGERISIEKYSSVPMKIYMSYRALFKEMDIDLYAFMLDETGVTSCDDDFVFFGNRETMSGALTFNEDNSVEVDLTKVPDHIKRISFVYSIYQPGLNDNFSKVMDPFISVIQNNREIVRYTASELFAETTIIFMDMYKHSSGWKLNTIGQGYREGLKRLCANYGLIVS